MSSHASLKDFVGVTVPFDVDARELPQHEVELPI
jgi:hypothetical protein